MSRRELRREARRDVGGNGGVGRTSLRQWKSLRWLARTTRRVGSSVAVGNWSNGCHRAGWTCSAPRIRGTYQPFADWCTHGRKDGDWKSANQQRRVPISNRRAGAAGLEVLGERDVSWKESRHEAHQQVTGVLVIEVLLLPEMSRDELA